jgi:predicted Zn-dependent protease
MGEQGYQEIMRQFRGEILPEWDPRVRMVERVMNRLIPVSGLESAKWQVHVIDADEINAFVLPG